ncbi:hypothetical protein HNE05_19570 [Aquipseudomonas campi]|uniref:Uncharacterized protein n=1 Tax=Aquipseudomonas campi TaxID=2731681 RepID=A0A6M8G9H0_9GAMM|nr:hypothetical protein [Pseudomonas campi]QKE65465.1 hypothetical protein HNE05_19570 [Pseudomonas campi]
MYFRIGSDKAGTVSIANLVEGNSGAFSAHGVCAPVRNCIFLLEQIQQERQLSLPCTFIEKDPDRRMLSEGFLRAYKAGEHARSDIFLTTESLWGRLSKARVDDVRKGEQALRFLEAFRDFFRSHNFKIVLHLRRIDLYLESLYKQEVKAARTVSWDVLREKTSAVRAFAFFRLLEQCFGPENIIVRPFERSQLYKQCAVQDMLKIMGLADYAHEFSVVHGNEGLHRDLMETLIHMNARHGKVASNSALLSVSSRLKSEFDFKDVGSILDIQTRYELLEEYKEFYQYLAGNYAKQDSLFLEEIPSDQHLSYSLSSERAALIERLVFQAAQAEAVVCSAH